MWTLRHGTGTGEFPKTSSHPSAGGRSEITCIQGVSQQVVVCRAGWADSSAASFPPRYPIPPLIHGCTKAPQAPPYPVTALASWRL